MQQLLKVLDTIGQDIASLSQQSLKKLKSRQGSTSVFKVSKMHELHKEVYKNIIITFRVNSMC